MTSTSIALDHAMKAQDLFNVTGKITIVTGGASGIGYAYAEVMADNGAIVTLMDIDPAALEKAATKLKASSGAQVFIDVVDVTQKASIKKAFAAVAQRHGKIEVVFANAGISGGPGFLNAEEKRDDARAFENLSEDLWERVIATNLGSVFKTIQVATPYLKQNGGGKIVVTSSVSAFKIEQYVSAIYVTSKAGVAQLLRQAALELARYNIQVNALAPGPCATNIGGGRLQDKATQDFFATKHPNHRMATPDDMKGAALYLASPASRHVVGEHIIIDGGISLGPAD
jgi:NAD(P)-dependent dehydrogenase (short-subunit alcohol dehydrogenase family)